MNVNTWYVLSGMLSLFIIAWALWLYWYVRIPKQKTVKTAKVPDKINNKIKVDKQFPDAEGIKTYDIKDGMFLSKKQFKRMKKVLKKWQESAVFIIFQTSNGKFKTWVQEEDDGGFKYKKKQYVFDIDNKVHFIDMDLYGYFFQEQFDIPVNKSLVLNEQVLKFIDKLQSQVNNEFGKPIDKIIEINEVKEAIDTYGLAEVENAFDPVSLKRFIDTQVILQVMGGAWFTKIMKIVLVISIIQIFIELLLLGGIGYIGFQIFQFSKSGVFAG